jgi:hypothetical protein
VVLGHAWSPFRAGPPLPALRAGSGGTRSTQTTPTQRIGQTPGTSTTTTTIATTATEPTATVPTGTTITAPTHPPTFVLPNPDLTPGAYNPKVRQKTIKRTICVKGWTKKIRPPLSYTNALKLTQMTQYGETGSPADYEEDHFIPLELGGAQKNPKNLWPEPHAQSKISDPLETEMKRRVCHGELTLKQARTQIREFKNAHG